MPPAQKITKDAIKEEAFRIVQMNGADALNARLLAKNLGCSTQPIFSSYPNMEALYEDVIKKAEELYNIYLSEGLRSVNALKGVGHYYISFAQEEPYLFKALFIDDSRGELHGVLDGDESYRKIIRSIEHNTGLPVEKCERLYFEYWIFTHGIATMTATGMLNFTEKQASGVLDDAYIGLWQKHSGMAEPENPYKYSI